MSDIVIIAVITVAGPILLSVLNGIISARLIAAKEKRDYERQDMVAQRVELLRQATVRHGDIMANAINENTALTKKIEIATNSMKDDLVAAARAGGFAAGVKSEKDDKR